MWTLIEGFHAGQDAGTILFDSAATFWTRLNPKAFDFESI